MDLKDIYLPIMDFYWSTNLTVLTEQHMHITQCGYNAICSLNVWNIKNILKLRRLLTGRYFLNQILMRRYIVNHRFRSLLVCHKSSPPHSTTIFSVSPPPSMKWGENTWNKFGKNYINQFVRWVFLQISHGKLFLNASSRGKRV